MKLLKALRTQARADPTLTLDDWAQYFTYEGLAYQLLGQQTLGGKTEEIGPNFTAYVQQAYKSNGVVFACMLVRMLLFSEARFQFRRMRFGKPGDLFGTQALEPLEKPWERATTGDLLARAIQDVDLAGNFFAVRRQSGIRRLRPDWVTIILASDNAPDEAGFDLDADVFGYLYHPGGMSSGEDPVPLLPQSVAHFAPIPDPLAMYRGMSWLTPVIREIQADQAATMHKVHLFDNGATPNMVVSLKPEAASTPEMFEKWIQKFKDRHGAVANKRTLYLGGGANAEVVGANLQQLEFKATQGAGETRIAAAAGVPPVIVGLSEGLQAATYSNYGQARRRFADGTMRPLWRNISGSLAPIIDVPDGAELWYDDRDIPFLQEDQKDAAEIQQTKAITIRELINAGYKPESVIAAVEAEDFTQLQHTGMVSVQLQPPGTQNNGAPASNGEVPAGQLNGQS